MSAESRATFGNCQACGAGCDAWYCLDCGVGHHRHNDDADYSNIHRNTSRRTQASLGAATEHDHIQSIRSITAVKAEVDRYTARHRGASKSIKPNRINAENDRGALVVITSDDSLRVAKLYRKHMLIFAPEDHSRMREAISKFDEGFRKRSEHAARAGASKRRRLR